MPKYYKKKYRSKYSKRRSRYARKKYRNREQKLSILTVKKIAQEAVKEAKETNYAVLTDWPLLGNALGNPVLITNAGSYLNPNVPKPRITLLTKYQMTYLLDKNILAPDPVTTSNGLLSYHERQKLYIKNIQIALEIRSPSSKIGVHDCSQWCTFHWALIKTSKSVVSPDVEHRNPPINSLFKDEWKTMRASFLRANGTTQGFQVVKKGQFDISPNRNTSITSLNNFSYRIIRKKINIPVKANIRLKRTVSTVDPDYTDATPAGNENSSNYYLLMWCNQEKQLVNSTSFQYTNANIGDVGGITAAPYLKYQVTLSGHGEMPT